MFRLIYLSFIILTYRFVVRGAEASTPEALSTCVDRCSTRTLFDIIWGCLSTTIICAWSTLHPNIPPREGPLKATFRKVELMLWTILAPELLPAWALNQRLAAMRVRDTYNNMKGYETKRKGIWKSVKEMVSFYEIKEPPSQAWTLRHGHFLIMGGIHLVEPPEEKTTTGAEPKADKDEERQGDVSSANSRQGRVVILTFRMLGLLKNPDFEIRLTEDDIMHKSRGDGLSKLIFILQTSWFIVQCAARGVQGLDLTQLELTTLALASLNGITFLLWWEKPLGAQGVLRVYLKRKLTDKEIGVDRRHLSLRSTLMTDTRKTFKSLVLIVRKVVLCQPEALVWLLAFPFAVLMLLFFPVMLFTKAVPYTISDIAMGVSSSFPAEATHVPTFYVPGHRYYVPLIHGSFLMILAAIFGAIHCAGWNFPFQTSTQQILWRVASLAIAVIPVASPSLSAIVSYTFNRRAAVFRGQFADHDRAAGFAFGAMMVGYVSARALLLGLAIRLLSHQPPGSFVAVDWTKFYPHL